MVFGVIDMTVNAGLPPFIAYGNYIGEFVAPFCVDWLSNEDRCTCNSFQHVLSILIGHSDIMFKVNDYGGWMIETNMLYMLPPLRSLSPARESTVFQRVKRRGIKSEK